MYLKQPLKILFKSSMAKGNRPLVTKISTFLFFTIVAFSPQLKAQQLLKDINSGQYNANPQYLTNVNGKLFFSAGTNASGAELYSSDGTAAGTAVVKNINTAANTGSAPLYLVAMNNIVYFQANDGTNGTELWRSDGTAAGTYMVSDIYAGGSSSSPSYLTVIGNTIYFTADDATHGIELWKTDGTATGTVIVKDIDAGTGSSSPLNLTVVNNELYFQATDGFSGIELWKSNGSTTTMVSDIYTGFNSSSPSNLVNINGELYFSATDASHGAELWKSDGTSSGTVLVSDIYPGATSSNPNDFTYANNTILFAATSVQGTELWKTDGSANGTVIIKDINAGNGSSNPADLNIANGIVYFRANNGVSGSELWASKGDAGSTFQVADISAGAGSSTPANLFTLNNVLYFAANNGSAGLELFTSDGSSSGTFLISDINSGTASSNPGPFFSIGNTLYFPATDVTNGRELWVYTPPVCVTPTLNLAVTGSTGCTGSGSATVQVTASQSTAYYQPYAGTSPVGASVTGGGTITLSMLTNALATGNNTISVKVTSPGCPASFLTNTATVIINTPPSTSPIPTGNTVCQGIDATITISNAEASVSYQPFIGSTAAGANVNSNNGGKVLLDVLAANLALNANTITVEATKAGCPSVALSTTATVTTIASPAAPTVTNVSNCGPDSVKLVAAGAPAGGKYHWYSSATGATYLGDSTAKYHTPALSVTTTYYVSDFNSSGCESVTRTPVTVTINAIPTAPTTTGATNCGPGTVKLTASGTPANGTYNWYTVSTGGTAIAGANTATYTTPSLTATTTYYVSDVSSALCESTTRTAVTATINPIPAGAVAGNNGALCAGSTLNLTASTVNGVTYSWTGPGNFTSTVQNPVISNTTVNASGSYAVTTVALGCSSTVATTTVLVNPIPAAPVAANNGALCAGSTLNLTATTVNGATYAWTGPNTYASTTQNPTITNTTTANSGTYSVKAIAAGCSSAVASTTVLVNAIPATPTAANNGALCAGSSLNLTASNVNGATYAWTGPNTYTSTSQNPVIPNATTGMSGVYSVKAIAANCSSPAATTTVVINAIPATPVISNNGPVCTGNNIQFTASTVSGATYAWTGPDNYTSNTQSPTIPNAVTANSGVYSVTTSAANCTSAVATTTVVVNTTPAAPTAVNADNCGAGKVSLTAGGTPTGGSYKWYSDATGATAIAGATTATYITPSISTSTTYYVTDLSPAGCESASRTAVTASIKAVPAAPTAANDSICGAGSVVLYAKGAANGDSYRWYSTISGGTAISGATGNVYTTPSLSATANYYVSILNSVNCESTRALSVAIINSIPQAAVTTGAAICDAGKVTLTASGASSTSTYNWYTAATGGTAIAGVSSNTYTTPLLSTNTTYYVTIVSSSACESSSRTPVTATINTTPVVNAGTNDSLCVNASPYTLTGFTPAGGTWSGNGVNNAGLFSPNAGLTGANTLTYTVTQNGCTGTNVKTVRVNALPSYTTSSTTATCGTPDGTATVSLASGYTYNWSNGQATQTASNLAGGSYTVTVTSIATNCSNTQTVAVATTNAPVVSYSGFNNNLTYCSADSAITLTGTPVGGTFSGNGITGDKFNPFAAGSGAQTIVYQVTQNGCVGSQTQTVTVNQSPIVNAGSNDTICVNAPGYNLANYTPAGGTWTGNGISNTDLFTPANAGVQVLTYTVVQTGCIGTATKKVLVNALPNVITALNDTVCANNSPFTITNATPAGGTWSGAGVSAAGLFTPNNSLTGVQTLTYTVLQNKCANSNTYTIVVNQPATVSAGAIDTVCSAATPFQLTGFIPANGTWSGNGVTPSGQFTGANAGVYKLTYTVSGGGCTSSDTTFVILKNSPTVTAGTNVATCSNAAPFTLTGFSPAGGTWTGTGVSTSGVFTPDVHNTGTYTLTYSVTQNGCTAAKSIVSQVDSMPATPVLTSNLNTVTSSVKGASYTWLLNGQAITANTQTIDATASGNYSVIVGNNGCSSDTSAPLNLVYTSVEDNIISFSVNVYPNPAYNQVTVKGGGFNNKDLSLVIFSNVGSVVYTETISLNQGQFENSINIDNLAAGVYYIQLSGENAIYRYKLSVVE